MPYLGTEDRCNEYEGKSLEELRLEDYMAGHKGPAADTGLFGGFNAQPLTKPPFGASGGFEHQTGTAHAKYNPLTGTDVIVVSGSSQNINTKHHCIICMQEYEGKSLEELRLEDYTAGRKGPAAGAGLFGGFSAQPEPKPLFGASGGFGQQQQQTGTAVKYNPQVGTDVIEKSGDSQTINIRHHCITCMKEYECKSLEELRLEDYTAGRKGPTAGAGLFGGFSAQPKIKPLLSNASGTFGQQQQQAGTAVLKYKPQDSTDVIVKSGDSQTINIRHHCITVMKEYEGKSLEELRLEDYTAGRKGAVAGAGLFGGFSAQPETKLLFEASRESPRTSCTGGTPKDLPPLSFHSVHGVDATVSRDGSVARFVVSPLQFREGLAFSARPVSVNEKVSFRFLEVSISWSNGIKFGFTAHDPTTLPHSIRYRHSACVYIAYKPGYWVKTLGEQSCEKDDILYYYVNSAGDVHFGINGEDKGIFFSGVDTSNPLWALIVLNKNCIAVQFAEPKAPNQIRRSNQSPLDEDKLVGSMRSLSMEESLPPLRYQSQAMGPLSLHRTKGRNIQFINDKGVAARTEAELCQGYVFTARPMRPEQTIVVQILATKTAYAGSLAIGLTSCDPAMLRPCDLPDDAENLLDRPEYWVVRRDSANGLHRTDELAVTLTLDGEVQVGRNGSNPVTVMHVDHTLRLWAFVDIYGATQRVRLLSSEFFQHAQMPAQQLRENTKCTICFENPIDSVLYMCGHMCMCYQCALRLRRGKDGGQCPLCRAKIKDVIRTYKS